MNTEDRFIPIGASPSTEEQLAWDTEPRAKIRIDVVPDHLLIACRVVPAGVSVIDCPESLVDSYAQLVEDRADAAAMAKEAHERKLKKWVDGKNSPDTYPGSVAAEFCSITGRGFHPLRSLEVLQTGVPAPLPKDARLAAAMASGIAQATSPAVADTGKKSKG